MNETKAVAKPDEATEGGAPDAPAGAAGESAQARSHFIPFRKADVIEMCAADGALAGAPAGEGSESFRELTKLLSALFHFEYHERLETLKDSFVPVSSDPDVPRAEKPAPQESVAAEGKFLGMLREVLTQANFTEIDRAELTRLLASAPGFKVRLEVDLDDFAEVLVFRRRRRTATEIVKRFKGLVKREVEVAVYDRVVVYARVKDAAYFEAAGRKNLPFTPGVTCLKLFQNVPESGLEMLFPNACMRMRLADKLLLGIPAAAGGLVVLATKLGAALLIVVAIVAVWLGIKPEAPKIEQKDLIALGIGLFALGMHTFRQINKVRGRRMKYMKFLTENLYFKVLDNNAGVFHHLIDVAEEEDCKEAILAYYFILTRKRDFTEAELDREIEAWFREQHATDLDFEVDDAMKKLERLELASRDGEHLRVKPLPEAKKRIDWLWDNFFTFNA